MLQMRRTTLWENLTTMKSALLLGLLSVLIMEPCAMALQTVERIGSAGYQVGSTWTLGGEDGWDLLTVDSAAHRLYIARTSRAMVVDTDTGALIGEIIGNGVHGIAVSPATNRGFVTNGNDQTVTIFDLKTLAILGRTAVGIKPDAIALDPGTGRIFVCNNGGTTLSVLDPSSGQVHATIELGGNPELIAVDGQGHLYTNLEDRDEVAVIDTRALTMIAHWPLAPGKGPSGVAVDAAHQRIFSACRESHTLEVLAADTGRVIASLPIGSGTDGAAFDPASGNIFCSNGDGTVTIIHEQDPMTFTVVQTLPTLAGARTIVLDESNHRLFTAAVRRQAAAAGATFAVVSIDAKR
jgi:YVTN family beta-propeller protein